MRKGIVSLVSVSALALCAVFVGYRLWDAGKGEVVKKESDEWPDTGVQVGEFEGVVIYSNGPEVYKSHGKHYSEDGYYYGHQWQCVEFVKRYYYEAKRHRMPNVWGHAKSYFQVGLDHGALNEGRGMLQYHNGGDVVPSPGDLLVWNEGPYGHVAVVSKVNGNSIEVAQQNIKGKPYEILSMTRHGKGIRVGGDQGPAGWLRLP